jgi:hypothetical protein
MAGRTKDTLSLTGVNAINASVRWKLEPAWSTPLKSSTDGPDSTVLSKTERERLFRELADEFGYDLMSKVANYSYINRLGTLDHEGKLIPDSDL